MTYLQNVLVGLTAGIMVGWLVLYTILLYTKNLPGRKRADQVLLVFTGLTIAASLVTLWFNWDWVVFACSALGLVVFALTAVELWLTEKLEQSTPPGIDLD